MIKEVYKDNVVEYYEFSDAKQSDNEDGVTVAVDVDDFMVIRAAELLQKMLNGHRFKNGVIFETNVIHMFEQLCRNCLYYAKRVEEECKLAKQERREPDLSRFPLFKNYNIKKFRKYSEPVDIVMNIYNAARFLKEHFFEERDTCLEIDTHEKGYTGKYNIAKEERIIKYCQFIINSSKDAFHEINSFCLEEVKRISEEAKSQNVDGKPLVNPKYAELVNMDHNDITKCKAEKKDFENLSESEQREEALKYQKYVLYEKAIEDVKNCLMLEDRIQDVVTNGAVYSMESERAIDYDKIYVEENLDPNACKLLDEILEDENVKEVIFASHYNGQAEGIPKVLLMGSGRFKGVKGIILIRFHDKEHNVLRRGRSCKMLYVIALNGRTPDKYVLGDDSVVNCREADKLGCLGILLKPLTDSEIIKGVHSCLGCVRMLKYDPERFRMFIKTVYDRNKGRAYKKAA